MKATKHPRVLFFLKGIIPTLEEQSEAEELGNNVAFRNASVIADGDPLEAFDKVAGAIPASYAAEVARREADGEPEAPEPPKSALPPAGSPVAPPTAAPAPKPGAGGGWKPNA